MSGLRLYDVKKKDTLWKARSVSSIFKFGSPKEKRVCCMLIFLTHTISIQEWGLRKIGTIATITPGKKTL